MSRIESISVEADNRGITITASTDDGDEMAVQVTWGELEVLHENASSSSDFRV